MKFFIDTANIDEIKKANEIGLLDGVTTNPTLISREVERTGKDPKYILKEICSIVDGPVSGEVMSLKTNGMVQEAEELKKIADNICIKIPMTENGLRAVSILTEKGIDTNVTLVFSPIQAVLAAKAGATYVSPFVGRLDDIVSPGMTIIQDIMGIFYNYDFSTEVIVASIRNPLHVLDAMRYGADISTIPYKVLMQLIKHPLTDIGIERFLNDYKKINK